MDGYALLVVEQSAVDGDWPSVHSTHRYHSIWPNEV